VSRIACYPIKLAAGSESAMRGELESLVPLIYDAALEPEAWEAVAAGLARFVGVRAVILSHLRLDALWVGQTWAHGLDPARVRDWLREEIAGRSVYARASVIAPEGHMMDLRAAGGGSVLWHDPGVETLMTPLGLREACGGAVLRDAGMLSAVSCFDEGRRGPLEEEVFARLRAVIPHLRRAMAIHQRVARLREDRRLVDEALARIAVALAILTPDLRVLFTNCEAERILAERDGLHLTDGRLRLGDSAATNALSAAVSKVQPAGIGDTFLYVPRPSGKPPLTLCIGYASATADRGAAATLYISDPASPRVLPPASRLAARFGLTEAEAEVARLAAMGLSMPAAATTLDVSVNTVRTHLKSVYGKTEVHSQAALTSLIETSFPPLRPTEQPPAGVAARVGSRTVSRVPRYYPLPRPPDAACLT
jgi:DNA-binding CsgD family transcriptional regulator